MERMKEERLAERVWRVEVSGVRPKGRRRRKWMDGVEKALDARGKSVEQGRESGRDRNGWRMIANV